MSIFKRKKEQEEKKDNITTIWYPDEADEEIIESEYHYPESYRYHTEIRLVDEPVYAVIPYDPCNNVKLILTRYKIDFEKPDEWSREMMLHDLPRTVLYKGKKVRGLTIRSRVPQEEILRIAEEVEGMDPYDIADRETRNKVNPVYYPPQNHVIKIEVNEDTDMVTEYYEDGHTRTHPRPKI